MDEARNARRVLATYEYLKNGDVRVVISGKLKWFNESKGFGFIQRDDVANGKDVFLHASEIKKNPALSPDVLVEGALLNFEVQDAPRGPKAVNVQLQGGTP